MTDDGGACVPWVFIVIGFLSYVLWEVFVLLQTFIQLWLGGS
jgi:hypothetical protein